MRGINKVILLGRLGADPDIRYMPGGEPVANLSLATSETWKDKQTGAPQERTEWHRVVAFRKPAEIIAQYCKKGSKLYVEGKLHTRKWQAQDGSDRYTTEIIIDDMQMLDSKPADRPPALGGKSPPDSGGQPDMAQNYAQASGRSGRPPAQMPPADNHDIPPDFQDDEIPF